MENIITKICENCIIGDKEVCTSQRKLCKMWGMNGAIELCKLIDSKKIITKDNIRDFYNKYYIGKSKKKSLSLAILKSHIRCLCPEFEFDELGKRHPDTIQSKKYKNKYMYNLRIAVINKLGGKCKCGFSDIRALQIDHINGNGAKERRNINCYGVYKKIMSMDLDECKKNYQILCANCNWIKRHEKEEFH